MVKEENGEYKSIYYVSKILQKVKTRYSAIEKFAYVMAVTTIKMKPYFQAHLVVILTN